MSPDRPSDPQKGRVEDTTAQEAEQAKAAAAKESAAEHADQPEAKPKRSRAKKPAEGQAAETTGVDKVAAAETAEKPKRTRAKKEDEAAEDEGPTAAEVEAKASEEAAASQPASKKEPKSRTEKDEPATPAPPAPKRGRKRGADNGKPAERVLVQAKARYVRTSPRKARLVCDHIRGKDVTEARAILAYTPRGAAKAWIKLLESAVANAEHNHELVGDELRIAAVYADVGPTLKRFRPRAMGRATRIRKRTSHLTIALTPKES
jgi:large subunit ribosomal protein L22